MKALVIVGVAAMALAGCGGGGKSSAANTAALCADWGKVVALDNSDVGGSIALYTQVLDLYKKVEGEAPGSIKSDLKVLVADEQKLVDSGNDSSSEATAAQTASDHVDAALSPLCGK
jgi:hypothetical protein